MVDVNEISRIIVIEKPRILSLLGKECWHRTFGENWRPFTIAHCWSF